MRIATEGLHAAQWALATHAHNIANVNSEGAAVDLPTEIVGVITARHAYDANARVLKAQLEQDKSLLDVLA